MATVLSAQCTDARVNLATPGLFARFPDARSMAGASPGDVEALIHSTGFFRAKARNVIALSARIVERHEGEVPRDLDSLTDLPGVGRKTAHVVLGNAFGIASGVVVDTHVKRLAYRLGMTSSRDPVIIERELCGLVPRSGWIDLSHRLIDHGRRTCLALRPRCDRCALEPLCPRRGVAPSSMRSGNPPPNEFRRRSIPLSSTARLTTLRLEYPGPGSPRHAHSRHF
ncbi:MAG: endonuclease III [Singulisphaera sp.]